MKSYPSFNRIILILFLLLGIAWILYGLLGNRLIEAVYNGTGLDFLDRQISRPVAQPLETYLRAGNYYAVLMTLWLLLLILFMALAAFALKKHWLHVFVINFISVLLLYETSIWLLMSNPAWLKSFPKQIHWHVKRLYSKVDLNIIQFRDEYTQYDPYVTYTLRPGEFMLSGREFKTKYRVNSLGLRDDEKSLESPEIIVLGDSVAMGYGVEQDEAFPQLIEQHTGFKVLNAGVSSYGTVRELRILERVDTSSLKYLIIQYLQNDFPENQSYFENGTLEITDRKTFQKMVSDYSRQYTRGNFFSKYSLHHLNFLWNRTGGRIRNFAKKLARYNVRAQDEDEIIVSDQNENEIIATPDEEVEAFLYALRNTSVNLEGVQIIVLGLQDLEKTPPFLRRLEERKSFSQYPSFIRNLITLDVSPRQSPQDRFVLDDHPTRKGHQLIASESIKLIEELENQEKP